jgi:O-phosphoseryl-tRNA(Cys) synthetase
LFGTTTDKIAQVEKEVIEVGDKKVTVEEVLYSQGYYDGNQVSEEDVAKRFGVDQQTVIEAYQKVVQILK